MKLLLISLLALNVFTGIRVLASADSSPRIVIISDIDDTIKISHVLDKSEALRNAFDYEHPFKVMSNLYQEFLKANPQTHIAYVSNAPDFLMQKSHAKFLNHNSFPTGDLMLSESLDSENHKIQAIHFQIEKYKPDVLIMLGDNGEKDINVYDQIQREYSATGLKMLTYIRIDYSSQQSQIQPKQGQKKFVTASEVALDLLRQGYLSQSSVLKLVDQNLTFKISLKSIFRNIFDTGFSIGLPKWVDCHEHKANLTDLFELSPKIKSLSEKITERCALIPRLDK